jgi:hypothetical protein
MNAEMKSQTKEMILLADDFFSLKVVAMRVEDSFLFVLRVRVEIDHKNSFCSCPSNQHKANLNLMTSCKSIVN